MTKTTEELKREMYKSLANLKGRIEINYSVKDVQRGADEFENELEDYLEALKKDRELISLTLAGSSLQGKLLLDAYSRQIDLTSQARTEADRERNRAQAFEFANKSAGEFLISSQDQLAAANSLIKRQRQSIDQLKRDRNNAQALAAVNYEKYQKARKEASELRKAARAMPVQDSTENASCDKCGGGGVMYRVPSYRNARDGAEISCECQVTI